MTKYQKLGEKTTQKIGGTSLNELAVLRTNHQARSKQLARLESTIEAIKEKNEEKTGIYFAETKTAKKMISDQIEPKAQAIKDKNKDIEGLRDEASEKVRLLGKIITNIQKDADEQVAGQNRQIKAIKLKMEEAIEKIKETMRPIDKEIDALEEQLLPLEKKEKAIKRELMKDAEIAALDELEHKTLNVMAKITEELALLETAEVKVIKKVDEKVINTIDLDVHEIEDFLKETKDIDKYLEKAVAAETLTEERERE